MIPVKLLFQLIKLSLLLLICPSWAVSLKSFAQQKPIVVIVPSYNTEKWCSHALRSILNQNYENYRVIFIDDSSQDDTLNCAFSFLREYKIPFTSITFDDSNWPLKESVGLFKNRLSIIGNQKWIIIHNKNRSFALANIYKAVFSCPDDAIIVLLDGDDWLAHPRVFLELNKIYSKKNVWLTHGSFIEYPTAQTEWSIPIPKNIIRQNLFRNYRSPSHLRTFYAALFKKIDINDLLYENNFLIATWDIGIMIPMIEMAGERHHFIRKINYVYNVQNTLNDNKVRPELQRKLETIIRKKPRYKRIDSIFS